MLSKNVIKKCYQKMWSKHVIKTCNQKPLDKELNRTLTEYKRNPYKIKVICNGWIIIALSLRENLNIIQIWG